MRINKYLASCNIASRRKSEEIILSGRVKVNSKVVTELSYDIDEKNDIVLLDDKEIKPSENLVYIVFK